MQNLGNINKTRARRPYWLLLALVLFFAGQIATASHWHNDLNKVDADCALCMLSSANSAAAIDSALPVIAVVLFACIFLFILPVTRSGFSRCYDSRAPPFHF